MQVFGKSVEVNLVLLQFISPILLPGKPKYFHLLDYNHNDKIR